MSSLAILEVPLYSIGEAARLLETPSSSLRRWLEGTTVRGRFFPPVIREQPTGAVEVTWAEFVEAGLLRGYRTTGVTLQRLRPFVEAMRRRYGVPYPLAHFRPLVDRSRSDLMVELKQLQDDVGLEDDLALVRVRSGQLVWSEAMRIFLDQVEFDSEGVGRRLLPLGKDAPAVVIDPEVAFGIPQIRGIRTETIAEAIAAGDRPGEIALSYGLTQDELDAAIRWELRVRPRTEAA